MCFEMPIICQWKYKWKGLLEVTKGLGEPESLVSHLPCIGA